MAGNHEPRVCCDALHFDELKETRRHILPGCIHAQPPKIVSLLSYSWQVYDVVMPHVKE